jgi:cysteine-rich repeat protein
LSEIVARGLAADPASRYPSMDELLADIERRRAAVQNRRRAAISAAALAVIALAATAVWRHATAPPPVRCGNGVLDPGEECDDGNRRDGDGCSAGCLQCREGDASFVWSTNGHCYSRHDQPRTWSDAEATCERLGGTLVTYTWAQESRAVWTELLREHDRPIWIGLASEGGSWKWVSGERTPDHLGWTPGSPGDGCVLAATDRTMREGPSYAYGNGRSTVPCSEARPFVCERPGWTARPRTGHLYRHFPVPQTWDRAAATCAAAHGHLATVADGDEQGFLGALSETAFWLGATDRGHRKRFEWTTGEPAAFRAFAPGEPDDEAAEACLLNDNRLWHDRPCAQTNRFVCEID